jgi:hypothetical protein
MDDPKVWWLGAELTTPRRKNECYEMSQSASKPLTDINLPKKFLIFSLISRDNYCV